MEQSLAHAHHGPSRLSEHYPASNTAAQTQWTKGALSKQTPEAAKELLDKDSSPPEKFGVYPKPTVSFADLSVPFNTLINMTDPQPEHTWACFRWDSTNEAYPVPSTLDVRTDRTHIRTY